MKLAGKTAIITGGGGGIGRAVSLRYAQEGARCVVADMQLSLAEAVVKEIKSAGGSALAISMDVTKQVDIDQTIQAAVAAFGQVDILFNNAAIFEMAPLLESSRESYDRLFDINVKGMFFVMQAVAAHMVEKGIQGKIVNLSSQAGRRGEALVALQPRRLFTVILNQQHWRWRHTISISMALRPE